LQYDEYFRKHQRRGKNVKNGVGIIFRSFWKTGSELFFDSFGPAGLPDGELPSCFSLNLFLK